MSITLISIIVLFLFSGLTFLELNLRLQNTQGVIKQLAQHSEARLRAIETRLEQLEHSAEKQDKLIAALWDSAYGYQVSDDDYLIYAWKKHPNDAFGIKPPWTVQVREDRDLDKLERNNKFPWSD